MLTGLYGVAVGYFTAVDWKTGESAWTLQAAAFVVGGIAWGLYALFGAIRPTKVTFGPPLVLAATTTLLLISSAIRGLIPGS